MSVDTKGYIKNNITWGDVYQYIKENIDNTAKHDFVEINGVKPSGYIVFNYKGENRMLFFCTTKDVVDGTEYDGTVEHRNLILGFWGNSVEIMQQIVSQFGGYVDDSDCDCEEAYYVPKVGGDEFAKIYEKRKQIESLLDGDASFKTKCAIAIIEHFDSIKTILED